MPLAMFLPVVIGAVLVGGIIFLLTRKLWKSIGNQATKQIEKIKHELSDEPVAEDNTNKNN